MGHMGHLKEEYQALLKRLDGGQVGLPEPDSLEARAGRREILEIMYTPEEADLASRLPIRPATLEKISHRVGVPEPELRPKLDALCDKGVVLDLVSPRTGKVRYALAPPVVGFFEFSMMRIGGAIPKKRMAEALRAYTSGDPTFATHVFGGDTVIGRSMVREDQLDDEVPDVLSWERATSVIEEASTLAVSICYCRHKAEHLGEACEAPQELCLSTGAGADFVIRRSFGREIDREEALAILGEARARGLVQIADNVRNKPTYICNCCPCCCGQLSAINEFGLNAVNPSGFEPRLKSEACSGCAACARTCPVKAVTMEHRRVAAPEAASMTSERASRGDGRGPMRWLLEPSIDEERCIGCGLCAAACKRDALVMCRHERPPHVPANAMERVLRMAIERGNLANLLVDQGESRGHQFMSKLLGALTRLSVSERLLAKEQVRSRFVSFVLGNVPDPTEGSRR